MSHTPEHLARIREQERRFWEASYAGAGALNRTFEDNKIAVNEVADLAQRADLAVEQWRNRFAPERVGLGMEPEWL